MEGGGHNPVSVNGMARDTFDVDATPKASRGKRNFHGKKKGTGGKSPAEDAVTTNSPPQLDCQGYFMLTEI